MTLLLFPNDAVGNFWLMRKTLESGLRVAATMSGYWKLLRETAARVDSAHNTLILIVPEVCKPIVAEYLDEETRCLIGGKSLKSYAAR